MLRECSTATQPWFLEDFLSVEFKSRTNSQSSEPSNKTFRREYNLNKILDLCLTHQLHENI